MSIELRNIQKHFGAFHALKGINLTIKPGELLALLGPSGSGKTTLLRIIAGLEQADSGTVSLEGEEVTKQSPGSRGVGFVFQHYALFRHMTVAKNVSFGLRVRPRATRPPRREIEARVQKLLDLVQLGNLAGRYPTQLSGGQRQRVALARALAVEPKVLLLDEPFGALDAQVRRELRRWLRELHDQTGVTTVFVTHDQEEALEVSDRVAILRDGQIEQLGTPDEVYEKSASPFVYKFLGSVNLFHGRLDGDQTLAVGDQKLKLTEPASHVNGPDATAFVRPHDIDLHTSPQDDSIPVTIQHIGSAGALVRLRAKRLDDREVIEIELPRARYQQLRPALGDTLHATIKDVRVFAPDYVV